MRVVLIRDELTGYRCRTTIMENEEAEKVAKKWNNLKKIFAVSTPATLEDYRRVHYRV